MKIVPIVQRTIKQPGGEPASTRYLVLDQTDPEKAVDQVRRHCGPSDEVTFFDWGTVREASDNFSDNRIVLNA
jgi:hypothetical protein